MKLSSFQSFMCACILLCAANAVSLPSTALDFDAASSDTVTLAASPATGMVNGFTVEAWAYPTTSTGTHRILSNFLSTPSRGFGFGIRNNNWRFTTFGIKDYDTAAATVTTGTWTHLAITLDAANTATFYRNGVLLAAVTHGAAGVLSTSTLTVGANPVASEYWQGGIDEIRVWNHVRSQSQIAANMNNELTGNEPGLLLYLPFSEGTGTFTVDETPNTADGTLNGPDWITSGPLLSPPVTEASDWALYP
jgi:hypothetical protein